MAKEGERGRVRERESARGGVSYFSLSIARWRQRPPQVPLTSMDATCSLTMGW